jgi:hypothetical protein
MIKGPNACKATKVIFTFFYSGLRQKKSQEAIQPLMDELRVNSQTHL